MPHVMTHDKKACLHRVECTQAPERRYLYASTRPHNTAAVTGVGPLTSLMLSVPTGSPQATQDSYRPRSLVSGWFPVTEVGLRCVRVVTRPARQTDNRTSAGRGRTGLCRRAVHLIQIPGRILRLSRNRRLTTSGSRPQYDLSPVLLESLATY